MKALLIAALAVSMFSLGVATGYHKYYVPPAPSIDPLRRYQVGQCLQGLTNQYRTKPLIYRVTAELKYGIAVTCGVSYGHRLSKADKGCYFKFENAFMLDPIDCPPWGPQQ